MATRPIQTGFDRENEARLELASRAGRPLTDVEWARMRDGLLEFAAILREWDVKARRSRPRLGTVEAPCQPEP
jgi:hypothetical protein